jgi:hypothetical protein
MGFQKKKKKRTPPPTNIGEAVGEKGTLIHYWWECKLVHPLWKTIWKLLKNLKIDLPYGIGIYLKECESGYNKGT